jgi:DNA gyrase subunit A
VRSMSLRKGDELISMDILPSQVIASMAESDEAEVETEELEVVEAEVTEVTEAAEVAEVDTDQGPWALVITTGGLGKRVPVAQFRLQNRAGMGLRAIKFRKKGDQLAAMQVVGEDDEIILVTSRGIIIRQAVKAISRQSRAATGVRVQRLDEDDAIVAVALVPPSGEALAEAEALAGGEALAEGELLAEGEVATEGEALIEVAAEEVEEEEVEEEGEE